MLADHPVQRLVGGFSFSNKILLLSSPAHHGWLGLITYGYVGVKTGAHPFSMRLEPTFKMSSAAFTGTNAYLKLQFGVCHLNRLQ